MLPPEQRQPAFLGAKSGVASSGFPSHHPQTPAAAKRRPEDPPREVQSMYVPVRELREKQRILAVWNILSQQELILTAKKREKDSGNCLPIPQPMRPQLAWIRGNQPASALVSQSEGGKPKIRMFHTSRRPALRRLQLYPRPQTDAPAHVCRAPSAVIRGPVLRLPSSRGAWLESLQALWQRERGHGCIVPLPGLSHLSGRTWSYPYGSRDPITDPCPGKDLSLPLPPLPHRRVGRRAER